MSDQVETNPYQQPAVPAERRSLGIPTETSKAADLAVSSFGASTLALCLLCVFPPVSLILSCVAIYYGRASLERFYAGDDRLGGRDIATAGITIGTLLLIVFALMTFAVLTG